ncbi:filamentation induced by cAMP protein Fic [Denitrovibrio acetiphilus DSM 12809]|uniref:Filamentation induced by cAMP protein Fic n=2 Tax=Denitrovibrio TaxID=117999 RepID=D4H557_DENA2|nr:filamentation induced by cAMP protein Fic [Denitrovibrio acetiphilus DSM 12809]
MLPLQDGKNAEKRRNIDNLIAELREKSVLLKSKLNPKVLSLIGDQVRLMNCYYSNLIEGHPTKPKDIEDALKGEFSNVAETRDLQLEATAHIEVQRTIDYGEHGFEEIVSEDFIKWIHRAFYENLPESLKFVVDDKAEERIPIIPGEYRTRDVIVGHHIGVPYKDVDSFAHRFCSAYSISKLGRHEQVAAAAASHHRLLWIHPFLDGNGRVARLFSHAYLKEIGVGSDLWSVSRGLARDSEKYKRMLAKADSERDGALDGRGNLSLFGLQEFCIFFLQCCIDQIDFMGRLIDQDGFLGRIEAHTNVLIAKGELHPKSFKLLSCAVKEGEFGRGEVSEIMGVSRALASKTLSELLKRGLLQSIDKKAPVRLAISEEAKEYWLPGLFG